MAAVLTTTSTLVCPHQFQFTVASSQQVLAVDDDFVVLFADLLGAPITTCTFPDNPCTTILSVTGGQATALAAGSGPVALDTAKGTTNSGPGLWTVRSAGQTKLEAT